MQNEFGSIDFEKQSGVLLGNAVGWGGVIWGGVTLSLITPYLGGTTAIPAAPVTQQREIPNAAIRRA